MSVCMSTSTALRFGPSNTTSSTPGWLDSNVRLPNCSWYFEIICGPLRCPRESLSPPGYMMHQTSGRLGLMTDAVVINELFDVSGKIVLVTGGTRGIGRSIAEGFVRAGARVYVCSRKADACEQTAGELSAVGECHGIAANL